MFCDLVNHSEIYGVMYFAKGSEDKRLDRKTSDQTFSIFYIQKRALIYILILVSEF